METMPRHFQTLPGLPKEGGCIASAWVTTNRLGPNRAAEPTLTTSWTIQSAAPAETAWHRMGPRKADTQRSTSLEAKKCHSKTEPCEFMSSRVEKLLEAPPMVERTRSEVSVLMLGCKCLALPNM